MNGPDTPLTLATYPQAIVHIDADAFFASVEEAMEPSLRGKPVVTGKERGVIACANYAAKARGVKRGIPLFEAKRMCPNLVILPSDYESYSLYSRRMFNIMRRFTPLVEEYSIDEAFADITGMRRLFRCSYEDIARRIQAQIQEELGITVSVGLSLSKSLAKLCSKFRKPRGFTAVQGNHIHLLLRRTDLEKVWGFGPNTVGLLRKFGLTTAYDYVIRPERWAAKLLHKPGRDLWNELRGNSVWKVSAEETAPKTTLLKSRTFTPPTEDRAFVYAQLVRNVEAAFVKLRRHRLRAGALGVVLRCSDFRHDGLEAKLNRPTASEREATPWIRSLFDRVFTPGCAYRASMVVLGRFENDRVEQLDFFEDPLKIESLRRITGAMDAINRQYGRHTIGAGTSLYLLDKPVMPRDELPTRWKEWALPGESARRHLRIPRWGIVV